MRNLILTKMMYFLVKAPSGLGSSTGIKDQRTEDIQESSPGVGVREPQPFNELLVHYEQCSATIISVFPLS